MFLRLLNQFFIAVGRPFYFFLSFLISKIGSFKIKLPKRKPTVIYSAPRFALKNFLKLIYPLTQLRLPVLKIPKLKIDFKFKISNFKLVALVLIGSIGIYLYVFKDLPAPSSLTTKPVPQTTHIRDRNGTELYKIYASQNRTLVKLTDIPLSLRQAIIAIEDAQFYNHSGFSIRGILRAISRNIKSDGALEGGSTITQQLVKTSLLSPEQTLRRKLRELILSLLVELRYSKDQILEMYLNRVSFGGSAYGVEEAAQTYFGKPAHNLTLAETAVLAGLPAAPTTYSPFGAHPELAKSRQKEVLRRMVNAGFITWDQAEQASIQELKFAPVATDIKAPHFVMYVKEILEQKYGPDLVEQGGLDVITSLDWPLQQAAQKAVTEEISKVAFLRIGNGAALVTNPITGEILSMVGSKNYFDTASDGNFNVVVALRQPGSAIKPVNYALAFTRGFTTTSIIDDSPITYRIPGQPPYTPVNYDGKYHGKVTLRTALGSSYNIPAVKVLAANGITNFIEFAQKIGISTWTDPSRYGLSLTLGGGEVTMLDMATAYGTFANIGQRTNLRSILSIKDSQGKIIEDFRGVADSLSAVDPKVAYLISDILSDNAARTPAFGSNSDLNLPYVAVKTGTTNNLRDNWTIGYTPDRLVAVWVGNNDNTSMSYVASGITGASPIWRRIFNEILKNNPSSGFTPPPGLIRVNICTITGQLACEGCPSKAEYFLPDTQPKIACTKEQIEKIQEEKAKKEQEKRDKLLNGASTP